MEIIVNSHANKTYFHKKGCVPSLILEVRVFGTRKGPIVCSKNYLHVVIAIKVANCSNQSFTTNSCALLLRHIE